MDSISAVITGRWDTKEVWVNEKCITPAGFVRDLKAAEHEPGDNWDILQECRGVRRFGWGDTSQAAYCLALACCFYLNCSWVMDRFFCKELESVPQADLRLTYDKDEIQVAYEQCEESFEGEFEQLMRKLGAKQLEK